MQTIRDQSSPGAGVAKTTLDWESLGRYVRTRTLDAVAMHFAATACSIEQDAAMRRKDCENRNHADAREDARPPVRVACLTASIALAVTPWTRDVEQTPILIESNETRVAINRYASDGAMVAPVNKRILDAVG